LPISTQLRVVQDVAVESEVGECSVRANAPRRELGHDLPVASSLVTPTVENEPSGAVRSQAYLRLLFVLLLPSALFDGYDSQLRGLLLPQIQHTFHASVASLGVANIPIQAGQFIAFFIVRMSDRTGRKRVLTWSIVGYTLFTGLTAATWSLASFAACQFAAQAFIGAEFGVAVTVVVEEFPAEKRAKALSKLLLLGPLGAVLAGSLLAAGLAHSPLSWRAFYLVGIAPLILIALARRWLEETLAFQAMERERLARSLASQEHDVGGLGGSRRQGWRQRVGWRNVRDMLASIFSVWRGPRGGLLLAVGTMSFLQALPTTAGVAWWTFYAEHQRHFSSGEAGKFVISAAAFGTLGYYVCGVVMERFGRRPTAIAYVIGMAISGVVAFQSAIHLVMFISLLLAVFFGSGIGPVLSAFATEPFPTATRAQASAWVRNGFANTGSLLGPALVGILAGEGLLGNVGNSVSLLAIATIPIIWVVWRFLPETRHMRLDIDPGSDGDDLGA
jgi:putative MFS transporter